MAVKHSTSSTGRSTSRASKMDARETVSRGRARAREPRTVDDGTIASSSEASTAIDRGVFQGSRQSNSNAHSNANSHSNSETDVSHTQSSSSFHFDLSDSNSNSNSNSDSNSNSNSDSDSEDFDLDSSFLHMYQARMKSKVQSDIDKSRRKAVNAMLVDLDHFLDAYKEYRVQQEANQLRRVRLRIGKWRELRQKKESEAVNRLESINSFYENKIQQMDSEIEISYSDLQQSIDELNATWKEILAETDNAMKPAQIGAQ